MSSPAPDLEAWRPCPLDARYEVSSHGRVRNARTGRVLRPQLCGYGYLKVHLGRSVQARVHRLVCEAFHGTPPTSQHHADHIDRNPQNNHATNLRWLTPAENRGRRIFRGRDGSWTREDLEEPPEDYVPTSDAERAALDDQLAAAGW